jgi:hypothetical protein
MGNHGEGEEEGDGCEERNEMNGSMEHMMEQGGIAGR